MTSCLRNAVVGATFGLALAQFALNAHAETICSDRPQLLAKHAGVYASTELMANARKTRRWDLATPGPTGVSELRVSSTGDVELNFGWHEAVSLGHDFKHGCLEFEADAVRLRHPDLEDLPTFERLNGAADPKNPDAAYFRLLFNGCFEDQGHQRWCFRPNLVEIAGQPHAATLHLDLSELPLGGSALTVAGEPGLWLLAPRGRGWAVYRTTWASAPKFKAPKLSLPWKVLTPLN